MITIGRSAKQAAWKTAAYYIAICHWCSIYGNIKQGKVTSRELVTSIAIGEIRREGKSVAGYDRPHSFRVSQRSGADGLLNRQGLGMAIAKHIVEPIVLRLV